MKNKDDLILMKFRILGIPSVIPWEDTAVKPSVKTKILTAIPKAPKEGLLLISGTSSPILQEFFKIGKKIAAIDFIEYFNSRHNDNDYQLPPARPEAVTLIYNVGKEPVNNFTYSSKVLQGLMSKYSRGLVVIETDMTPSNFNVQYGLNLQNKFSIPRKPDEVWT